MYFKGKEKKLLLSVSEAVRISSVRYGISGDGEDTLFSLSPMAALSEGAPVAPAGSVLFSGEFPFDDLSLSLYGCAEVETDAKNKVSALSFRVEVSANPERIEKSVLSRIRGVGFLLAYLAKSEGDISLCFELYSPIYDKRVILTEKPARSQLSRFFERVFSALKEDASMEIDRLTRRLPTFSSVPFPYGEVREGQKDMMSAVRAAAKHGETLFSIAPTGTGKTMAVLFPALRALGAREIEKVFYLTPKNTSALAALEAAELLCAHGALLRAVKLGAKERLCSFHKQNGGCRGCPKSCSKKRGFEAVKALLGENKAAVGEADILRVAQAYGVCPHELSLDYSLYADIVVCDYNYVFDPRVRLTRYFETGGEYLFLVDEAHNLPDRAREMYSATLSCEAFDDLIGLFAASTRLKEIAERLKGAFVKTVDRILSDALSTDEKGTAVGFAYTSSLPASFIGLLRQGADIYLKEIRKMRDTDEREKLIRDRVYALLDVCAKADRFDENFYTYAVREGESRTLRLFCANPSALLCEGLDKGRAAVFFSATLSPLDYYRSVLCGRRHTAKIEVPSPFDSGALCVGVVDSVSVRASMREDTLGEIAKLIVTSMRARRGNYMVFCPSFAYLERVAEAFHRLTPKTPIAVQKKNMTRDEREAFLNSFSADNKGYFVGFCVTGGIYAEGVDLAGERLIGAIVIGMGLPQPSAERECISAFYEDATEEGKGYAYFYPALNRIMQAAGRVIRTESDRGIVVLIDDRLRDIKIRKMFPSSWRRLKYLSDRDALGEHIARFWQSVDGENG